MSHEYALLRVRTFTAAEDVERIRELQDDWAMQGPDLHCDACPAPAWCWLDAGWALLSLCRVHAYQACHGILDRLAASQGERDQKE
jgi:hypothetical protein